MEKPAERSWIRTVLSVILCAALLAIAMYELWPLESQGELSWEVEVDTLPDNSLQFPTEPAIGREVISDCGSIILAKSSPTFIEYKKDSHHDRNERCPWIVNSKFGRVQVTVLEHDFRAKHSGLVFGEITHGEFVHCTKWSLDDKYGTLTTSVELETPALIYFTSDNVTARQGFVLEVKEVNPYSEHFPVNMVTQYSTNLQIGSFPSVKHPGLLKQFGDADTIRAVFLFQPWNQSRYAGLNLPISETYDSHERCDLHGAEYEISPVHEPSDVERYNACVFRSSRAAREIRREFAPTTVTKEAVLVLLWADWNCYLKWHWASPVGQSNS